MSNSVGMAYMMNQQNNQKKKQGLFDQGDSYDSSFKDSQEFADQGFKDDQPKSDQPKEDSKDSGNSEVAGASIQAGAQLAGGLMAQKAAQELERKKMMLEAEKQLANSQSKAQETSYNMQGKARKMQMDLLKDIYLRKNRGERD